jgi:hypothetical protein
MNSEDLDILVETITTIWILPYMPCGGEAGEPHLCCTRW